MRFAINETHCIDALELLRSLPDSSVDLLLTDPPYGTTTLDFDQITLDWAGLWAEIKRVMKPKAAVVMTSAQPFTTDLINSNRAWFRYDLIWAKSYSTQFMNAKVRPLRAHEIILVFTSASTVSGAHTATYNPQMKKGAAYVKRNRKEEKPYDGYNVKAHPDKINAGERYPTSVLEFPNSNHGSLHPTQKPVALFEYLIKTYSQPGELVIDPFMGSGTTAVAALKTGRNFIGSEINPNYVAIATQRVIQADPYQDQPLSNGVQRSLFADRNGG